MVWKFGTSAAQALHEQRLARGKSVREGSPAIEGTVLAAVAIPPLPAMLLRESRIEPMLHAQEPDPAATNIVAAPAVAVLAADPCFANLDDTAAGVPVLGMSELDEDDFPYGALTLDFPSFAGSPDDLPDLRPAPLPPMAHPGLQSRGANTFGHALRLPAEDERQPLWADQRRDRGFDDTELWGLDDAFSRFILPRLKALREQKLASPGVKMDVTAWYGLLDKMIRAFELLLPEGGGAWSRGTLTDRERAQVQEGLDLFRQYFFFLCW
jgi:hypothetical protein